jgi:energy-coupling factor transporter ATP-binding protein EcfA2
LETRLRRLSESLPVVSGRRVLLVGQPGAGKSTLADVLTRHGAVPRPHIGVETDATDWSGRADVPLWMTYGSHLVVDAPGGGTERHPVDVMVKGMPFSSFDAVLCVFRGKLHSADEVLLRHLHRPNVIRRGAALRIIRSCADGLRTGEREACIADLRRVTHVDPDTVWFCSARTGMGIDDLRRHRGLG